VSAIFASREEEGAREVSFYFPICGVIFLSDFARFSHVVRAFGRI
jgi:hypothetical protein